MGHLVKIIFETFFLVLMVNGTKTHGKHLIRWEILISCTIAQIIMMLGLINMVLNLKLNQIFCKVQDGLIG